MEKLHILDQDQPKINRELWVLEKSQPLANELYEQLREIGLKIDDRKFFEFNPENYLQQAYTLPTGISKSVRAQQTELIYRDIVELHQEFKEKLREKHRIFQQEDFWTIAKLEILDGKVTITEKSKQAVIDQHTEYINEETKKIVDEFNEIVVNMMDFRERTGYTGAFEEWKKPCKFSTWYLPRK